MTIPEGYVELRSRDRWYRVEVERDKTVKSFVWYNVYTSWGKVSFDGTAGPREGHAIIYEGSQPLNAAKFVTDTVQRKTDEGFWVHDRKIIEASR